jgi:threonine dehydrogenase-like Zn-dependent dehydrogenase
VKRDDLACVGPGAVGLMAVMVALDVGATVFAWTESTRELAASLGRRFEPTRWARPSPEHPTARADVVIEAAGRRALGAACSSPAPRSRLGRRAHFEPDYPLNNGLMFERELTCASPSATRWRIENASSR